MNIQDTTLHTLFEAQVQQKPESIALVYGKQWLTYEELNKKANQLAHYLLLKGLKSDSPVAVCMERSFEYLITILAILKAGGGYLPLDSTHPAERLLFILNDSNSSLLITKSELEEQFSHYQGTVISYEQEEIIISQQSTENLHQDIKAHQLAYVIYTSGSTGMPKGVLIEHRSVVNYCHWFNDYSNSKTQQRVDFSSNQAFDMAITLSLTPLVSGSTIVICADDVKKNTRHYLKYLKTSKINQIKLTPSFFKVLLQEVKNEYISLPNLKAIILGGENLPALDCKSWLELYPKHFLYNEYGPTETTVAVTHYKIGKKNLSDLELNVPIGQVGYGINAIIFNTDNIRITNQEIGELYISGACLARGYLNKPELTQKQFIIDPIYGRLYKTGDLCRQRADGVLEYFGRIDSQLKIRGYRIEPGEIERHLAAYSAIESVVVLAQKDPLNEDRLVAYYTLKDSENSPKPHQLREYLQNHVPEYMIPTAFISIDAFPLTANGKLDKSLLPNPQLVTSQEHREPLTALEKTLAAIWAEELGIKTIGLDDDFFELGGHSLSAARIISKINNELKKDITLHDFYHATNIAKLINVINKRKKIKNKSLKQNLKIFNKSNNIPLSDFQFLLWMCNTFEAKAAKLNITARKRLQGQLDTTALEFAFNAVLKKQEVLFYRVLKFRPAQLLQKNLSFKITEINLESLSAQDSEIALENSIKELIDFYPWPKESPLIIARLFRLKDQIVELQICLPHIVSDDFSPQILLSELSQFYLMYQRKPQIKTITADNHYKEYIFNEQHYMEQFIDRDTLFWENYLEDASLLTIPKEHIVKNMDALKLPYSTYLKIPENELKMLKQFCAANHISINDGLCAAVALALNHCTKNHNHETPYIYMNIVKSTRNNEVYDETIGCFLRLEPVKIALDKKSTLATISTQIHQSIIDTSLYQQCPDLVKQSSVSTFRQKRNTIKNFLTNIVTSIYSALFSVPDVNRKILKLCIERINSIQLTNHFLININIHRNFISDPSKEINLFGLDTQKIKSKQHDLLKIDNILDVCFLRDDDYNSPYLVISANLKPEFRELIAKETLRIISSTSFEMSKRDELAV